MKIIKIFPSCGRLYTKEFHESKKCKQIIRSYKKIKLSSASACFKNWKLWRKKLIKKKKDQICENLSKLNVKKKKINITKKKMKIVIQFFFVLMFMKSSLFIFFEVLFIGCLYLSRFVVMLRHIGDNQS